MPCCRAVIFLSEASLPLLGTEEPRAWAGGPGCAQGLADGGCGLGLTQPSWGFLPLCLGCTAPRTCHLLLPPAPHHPASPRPSHPPSFSDSLTRLPWESPAPSWSLHTAAGPEAAARNRASAGRRRVSQLALNSAAPLVLVEV